MASLGATNLYTETRLNLDESHVGSTIELSLDSLNPKRTIIGSSTAVDEATFSRENLANDASIFFRSPNRSLRSFLWRLLDDRKLLELQCVDLTQELGEDKESIVTLRLRFEHAVRPYCIAFADHEEKDALVVFAITTQGELYTITLNQDVFIHLKTTEALPTDWCRLHTPASLRLKQPYRLTAIKARDLFVSLSDGSLQRLEHQEHSTSWTETYYSASSWNVLPRALAKLKGDSFVRFGDIELDASTIVSVALSPDEENIITVCLNHTLRIWNARNGKVVLQADLLEADDVKVQQQHKYLISPTQRQLLQVLDVPGRDGDQYYIVTFSPKQQSFTFWAVLDAESGAEGVRRIQTDFQFTPPVDRLMQTSAWTLEEFYVSANRGWSQTKLWLRARSGPVSRVFMVDFALFEDDDQLEKAWSAEWVSVNPGQQATEYLNLQAPPAVQAGDMNMHCPNITEQWLDFLFYPGRFTASTLQTAVHVYVKGVTPAGTKSASSLGSGSLKELISNAVTRKAAFHLIGADHDQREIKTSEEWHVFYGLVQDLHKRRSTVVSFTFDPEDRLPWIIATDSVSPVRICTDLEISNFHPSDRGDLAEDQITKYFKASYEALDLLQIAEIFGQCFSPNFISSFKQTLLTELLTDPSLSVGDRIAALRNQTELGSYIGDEEWSRVLEAMDEVGGYDVLDYESFNRILELFGQESSGKQVQERLVRYGTKAVVRTTQENLSLHTSTLINLLLLVVFVETEIDATELEGGMQNQWKGQDIYIDILDKLKEQAVLEFLLKNTRIDQVVKARRQSVGETPIAVRTSSASATKATPYSVTLLESLFIGDWSKLHAPADFELPSLISYLAARWISDLKLTSEFDDLTAYVLADLIKHGDGRLASAFLPYVTSTGWSTYLRGRLALLTGEHDRAASYFNQAAYSMSQLDSSDIIKLNSAGLLRPDERSQLAQGLVGYFEHIMNLFDDLKSFSYVVEFAQTALQYQSIESTAVSHTKKSPRKAGHSDLPPSSAANLLSRLFTAALDSAQYDIAYSALVRLPDALRKACLQIFIDTLIRTRQAARLLSYPFATLGSELDAELAHKARAAPNAVAAKGAASYHRILYALRIQAGDFRGAAQCLWDYVSALKAAKSGAVFDPRDERLNEGYLMLINAMSCCGHDDAWVLNQTDTADGKKRRVVFLDEVRKEYQGLLDQASELEEGKYAFVGGEDTLMEVDML